MMRFMMTQQKTEEQLTVETIHNLEKIILFLKHSEQYSHQISLIKNLQSIVDGKNKASTKGTTIKIRTLESLKIAVVHTRDLKTENGNRYSQQEKATLMEACMKQVTKHLGHVSEDNIRDVIGSYMEPENRICAAQGTAFFRAALTKEALLSALFMGEENSAEKIVRAHPDLLFAKGTYKMPLLNQDGTSSTESEQIYRDTTPLQLMLYTGDWKMWERIFPLIPKEKLDETLQEMHKITLGGPDLVKIDRAPTQLSVDELRHYYEKNAKGKQIHNAHGNPIVYDLLCNPDGIFYVESNNAVQFYHVAINPETQEKIVRQFVAPTNITAEDEVAFNQFKADIRNNMPMNSSRRSSNDEHALIARVFGIELERHGIHYELNGKQYQDTYDGCIRLKNAYRRYLEIYNAHRAIGTPWDVVDAVWRNVVGMAQRFSMVHVMQRFCEKNQQFYPLKNANYLKGRSFIRTSQFENWITGTKNIYPLRVNSDVGFDFALYKGGHRTAFEMWPSDLACPRRDLAAVRLGSITI